MVIGGFIMVGTAFPKKIQNLLLYANKQGKLGGNYSREETSLGAVHILRKKNKGETIQGWKLFQGGN